MTSEQKKEWVKQFLGDAFVKGVSIHGNIARVVVKSEQGEKEVSISLPDNRESFYKDS